MATSNKDQISLTSQVSSEIATVKTQYQAGKLAFERGRYRESVQYLEKAAALAAPNSRLGGEVKIWLVTAYEAAGQKTAAIALCEQLKRHPDSETSKQGRRLLYILQAPQLKRPDEWLTQIPDMGAISDDSQIRLRGSGNSPRQRSPKSPPPEPVDLSQINTRDNKFIWAALIAIGLTLGGLFWWGSWGS